MARILIIDDSLYMRTMLKHILTDAGHEVIGEAADGKSGLKMVAELCPDMITLDVILPDQTGLDILKEIKRNCNKDIKVVLVSAVGQDVIIEEAMTLGANDYIVKPFSEEKVVQTVQRVVA
jgi:two-component system, chemotaxis family, chemotaxis protein CheY